MGERHLAIEAFIKTHEVFSTGDLLEACGQTQTNRNLLSRAVKTGRVIMLRRGLYASRCGKYEGAALDRFAIATRLFKEPVACCQSALELLGAAHYPAPRLVTVYAAGGRSREAGGIMFRLAGAALAPGTRTRYARDGLRVTHPAWTLVDCLDRPDLALGAENVLRSVPALEADAGTCLEIAMGRGRKSLARCACVLTLMGKEGEDAEAFKRARGEIGSDYAVLGYRNATDLVFEPRYRVYLPREAKAWIEG